MSNAIRCCVASCCSSPRRAGASALALTCMMALAARSQQPPAAPAAASPDVGTMSFTASGMVFHEAIPGRYAILIRDGRYVAQDSIVAAVSGAAVTNDSASGVRISSALDKLNGIYVTGKESRFTLADAQITLSGNGSDDMSGIGAGALVGGQATLTLRHVRITTHGVIASAASATAGGTLKVYDSLLIAHGASLPKGYTRRIGPGMMEPPAQLGITGTARASVTSDHAQSFFYRTTIIADGWGALSTDMANGQVYLEANDCSIRTLNSGYGTYADVGAKVLINHSNMNVATYLGIIAGTGSLSLHEVTANSRGAGVMVHDVNGSTAEIGNIDIRGGRLVSERALILVKSANAQINLEHALVNARNGVLIQSVRNEDPNATKVNGQSVSGIRATLTDMAVTGDIVHQDTDRTMSISLVGSSLKGRIGNAALSLDTRSRWTATADSTVTFSGVVEPAQIDARPGVTITARAAAGSSLRGSYPLKSGGMLNVGGS